MDHHIHHHYHYPRSDQSGKEIAIEKIHGRAVIVVKEEGKK